MLCLHLQFCVVFSLYSIFSSIPRQLCHLPEKIPMSFHRHQDCSLKYVLYVLNTGIISQLQTTQDLRPPTLLQPKSTLVRGVQFGQRLASR